MSKKHVFVRDIDCGSDKMFLIAGPCVIEEESLMMRTAERLKKTRNLGGMRGWSGCIIPTGIATDATTQFFSRDLVDSHEITALYDFENRAGLFPCVHRSMRFCLLTMCAPHRLEGATFVTFAHAAADEKTLIRRRHDCRCSSDPFTKTHSNTRRSSCPQKTVSRSAAKKAC